MKVLSDIKGISKNRLNALNKSGIFSISDLINYFPRAYLDRTRFSKIGSIIKYDEHTTVSGTVTDISEAGFGKSKRLEVTIKDETGGLKLVWFRGHSYIKRLLKPGITVSAFGQVKRFGRHLSIAHPDVEKLDDNYSFSITTGIIPIYPGNTFLKNTYITSAVLQKWMKQILDAQTFEEFIPKNLLDKHRLPEREQAYQLIHFPESVSDYQDAVRRFKFEELFLFELGVHKMKLYKSNRAKAEVVTKPGEYTKRFFNEIIPFSLTEGQKAALTDIKKDLISGNQMNRLIQGDVGSGKTIVAMGAILMCIDNGLQAAFMAPTEILAEQHYYTLTRFLEPLGLNIRLLTGGQKTSLRRDILSDIAGGTAQITIGTHALVQKEVKFNRLGIAVIDEQHRFGVMQRSVFLDKANNPHLLVMSATPIPRSLALTLYGDMDVSIIKGLPSGRKPVVTAIRGEKKRPDVYRFLESTLQEGGQAYIVYPLVEESEAMDLKDATAGFENVTRQFPEHRVGLLHGKMKNDEKESVMQAFTSGDIDILVSTTVIEVGVDVPNASVMIIEHAERFGLSQLHQLRGRVGRGKRQSYCILMAGYKQSNTAKERLKTMTKTNDGFEIAETDLRLRGPGDFLGTRQSGLPDFRVADLINDQHILELCKEEAFQLLETEPDLSHPGLHPLKKHLDSYIKAKERFFTSG